MPASHKSTRRSDAFGTLTTVASYRQYERRTGTMVTPVIVRLFLLLILAVLGYASFQAAPLEVSLAQQVTPTLTHTPTATLTITATPARTSTPSPTPTATATHTRTSTAIV